ncbi:MAG: mandelate racemase/muconate lactonizing enzyme family protein [Betaproteobacteria bacterium]|nr:mandelate racemase/muconate lactonizing enzyme family protein [Betaproteobacteria bacterium]
MKVTQFEILRADAGWRIFSFLKVMTDEGLVGWSEFNESFGSAGLADVIRELFKIVIGKDPRDVELINAHIRTSTIQARGGINRQAVAAIENALLDIKGKALGVPVYDLFGGAVRKRIPCYWSHCGSYRARYPELLGVPRVASYDDLSKLAEEVVRRGFSACKTNVMIHDGKTLAAYRPGFGASKGYPELNWNNTIVDGAFKTANAFRIGGGPKLGIMMDLNFNYKTEGYMRIAKAVEPIGMTWLEMDTHDPASLALIRRGTSTPIASCETLCERRDFKPFFEQYAMDVPIIDVIWNGYLESIKIAAMAEVYEMNVAPHNFYGHLSSVISAHFCAAVPNLRIMETDIDAVPWRDELVDVPPVIENGEFVLPTRPGWGVEVNEAGVRRHPPK